MEKKSSFLYTLEHSILFSIPLTFILSISLLRFGEIVSNGYIVAGFYNTILNDIFENYLLLLPAVIVIVFFMRILLPGIRPEKSKIFKFLMIIFSAAVFSLFILNIFKKYEKKPNLIFIVVDTLRDDHTSFENPALKTTENIRLQLLNKGVYFKNSHSNAPWTLPSISSMITSRYPSEMGVRNLVSKIGNKEFTLAEIMREEGYRTGSIISHILLKKIYGFSQGYDIYNESNISDKFGNHYSISSPGVTQDAIEFVKKNKNRKFFLFLHYFDPHYIYIDHEKKSGYKGEFTSKDISFLRERIREKKYTTGDLEYLKYCYDTEIRFTDRYIGKFLEELKQLGLFDNTLIIFTSDHGEEFVERGWLGHSTTLNSEQTSVPLIIKPPSGFPLNLKKKENMNISNIDIVPSVLSILKIRELPLFSGKNIFASRKNENTVFAEVDQKEFGTDIKLISVIWKEWKMIKDLNSRTFKLYNISTDQNEVEDLYGSFPDIESKLKLKLVKWERIRRKKEETEKRKKPLSRKERERLKTLGYIN